MFEIAIASIITIAILLINWGAVKSHTITSDYITNIHSVYRSPVTLFGKRLWFDWWHFYQGLAWMLPSALLALLLFVFLPWHIALIFLASIPLMTNNIWQTTKKNNGKEHWFSAKQRFIEWKNGTLWKQRFIEWKNGTLWD